MSRAQETDVANTAGDQNKTYDANAQTAFQGAQGSINQQQGDVNDYGQALSTFAAANPYGTGGAYQTSVNQSTAGTADAASDAAKQGAQGAAVRGGQNASAGVAAGQATDQANTRNLMTTQANANANRIKAGAGYGSQVLQGSSVPASLQGSITGEQGKLAGTEAEAGNTALSTDQKASEQPSFWDEFGEQAGGALGKGLGTAAGAGLQGLVGCWVASELYNGWFDPRTVDVRNWLFGPYRATRMGKVITDFYLWSGKWIAKQIRRHPILRRLFLPIFNRVLAKAREGRNG
jgi:hypothetical protein